ncbi:MAG: site-specific DNA-methyltransferase [Lactobacillus sp.]|nr:site-specific DNA-methyltransferase [Lactobacillus sp.]
MLRDSEKYNQQVKSNTAFLNELKNKLPEFFTKDGSFDLDKFKDQLREKNVNELSEGYQLDFIGKDYARRQAGEVSNTVIVPDVPQNQGEGKDSKNLFFTGDNLEVLRHLQNNYQNKIDVIYIDPPYNTGSDGFVYPDSFEYSDDKLKEMFGLDDDQVKRLKSIQGKSSHSAWLTFMYPRLVLAKQLLSYNGVIFISIDHNEQSNLTMLCDEIFGENNGVVNLVWTNQEGGGSSDSSLFRIKNENILTYARNISNFKVNGTEISNTDRYTQSDEFEKERGKYYLQKLGMGSISYSKSLDYPLHCPDGSVIYPKDNNSGRRAIWRWSKEKVKWGIDNSFIVFKRNDEGKYTIYTKQYLKVDNNNRPIDRKQPPMGVIDKFSSTQGSKELKKLGLQEYFSYPKPTKLIKWLLERIISNNALVLDFFAGSSTTADAVMQLNAEDGGHRKFIMVQLPEKTYQINKDGKEVPTKGGKAAYDYGFKSIDEISRERIRRASKKIKENNELTLPEDFDGSFKHYRVINPTKQTLEDIDNFDPNNTNLFTSMIDSFSSNSLNVAGDASGEQTILTTWLARDGYAFETEVEDKQFGNYHAHFVDDRLYLINEGWSSDQTKELLNQLGKNELHLQSIVLFGYSFNIAELRELESGLKQLDSKVTLIKRY